MTIRELLVTLIQQMNGDDLDKPARICVLHRDEHFVVKGFQYVPIERVRCNDSIAVEYDEIKLRPILSEDE